MSLVRRCFAALSASQGSCGTSAPRQTTPRLATDMSSSMRGALHRAVHAARIACARFPNSVHHVASGATLLSARHIAASARASWSHDAEAVARGDARWAITTPIISDQVSIPDGVVGDVVEIACEVGQVVDEGHVAVVIETHKACLNVKATGARRMRVVEILAQDGIEVKEGDPLLMVEAAAAGDR